MQDGDTVLVGLPQQARIRLGALSGPVHRTHLRDQRPSLVGVEPERDAIPSIQEAKCGPAGCRIRRTLVAAPHRGGWGCHELDINARHFGGRWTHREEQRTKPVRQRGVGILAEHRGRPADELTRDVGRGGRGVSEHGLIFCHVHRERVAVALDKPEHHGPRGERRGFVPVQAVELPPGDLRPAPHTVRVEAAGQNDQRAGSDGVELLLPGAVAPGRDHAGPVTQGIDLGQASLQRRGVLNRGDQQRGREQHATHRSTSTDPRKSRAARATRAADHR